MSHSISVPRGSDIALSKFLSAHVVIVAPPPLKADVDLLTRPGLIGLFTHDRGLTWPDRDGVQWANQYLEIGSPVVLQFSRRADAQACHERLLRSMPAPSAGAPR